MIRSARTLIAAALVSLAFASVASAGPFRLRIEDFGSGFGVVLTDNGPGDVNPVVGELQFSGAIGPAFTVNLTTGDSQPLIGGVTDFGQLHLNSINVVPTGAGTLRILLEDQSYTGTTGLLRAIGTVNGGLSAPAGSTVLVQTWANGGDVVPDPGADQPVGPIGIISVLPAASTPAWTPAFTSVPGNFNSTSSTIFDNGAIPTFSLFSQVVVAFTGPGSLSLNLDTQVLPVAAVPEPASLLLLGTGLAGLGGLRRRQRDRS